MYRRARGLALRGSSLALYNNLAVLPLPAKRLTYFASVHGASVGLLSAAADGTGCAHRQLQAREGGLGPPLVTQAAWCALPSRTLLVLASWKGIQMYEPDGSAMVYWHALDGMEASAGMLLFARGIAGTRLHFVCVGTSTGSVLVFDVPAKGTNITLSEVLEQHGSPITDIGAELCEQPLQLLLREAVERDHRGRLRQWADLPVRSCTRDPASPSQRSRPLDLCPGPGPALGEAAVGRRGLLRARLGAQPPSGHGQPGAWCCSWGHVDA
ncbi:WD repeat-containing protein 54 isoform X6 [Erythrolamprus reginae]|uniref:WD repeat-containing protein 54 isoform X6 n=1 Tax=Erythrolamprus reginae TaxID=121349 RepID=UPI00396CF979